MIRLELTNGMHALIDDEDEAICIEYTWYYHTGSGNERYANGYSPVTGEKVRLPRLILAAHGIDIVGKLIDHEDGNGLNNQKYNLRIATNSQNCANSGKRVTNTSGFKGVTWCAQREKWKSKICFNYKVKCLGFFGRAEDAAYAYDCAAIRMFGEFAYTNFPRSNYLTIPD